MTQKIKRDALSDILTALIVQRDLLLALFCNPDSESRHRNSDLRYEADATAAGVAQPRPAEGEPGTLSLVTLNVDGLGDYADSLAARMYAFSLTFSSSSPTFWCCRR